MTTPPATLDIDLGGVFLHDVPVDGAADIVRVRFRNADVLEVGGTLGHTTDEYDPATADLLHGTLVVTCAGTYAFGCEGAAEGGAASFTQDDADLVASTAYDEWGNAVASCAGAATAPLTFSAGSGCLRYGRVDYDPEFAQLATAEHLQVGPGASDVLTYSGTWDRGLGAITSSTDPNGLTTSVTYDGLGRLTSVTPPAVDDCPAGVPTTTIQYELTSNPTTQPLSRVITTTALDCDDPSAKLESIAYVDGLGRARAALATGDDDHAWVRSGITTLDKKGTVRRTYQTDFYDGADTALSSVVALPGDIPYAVTRYDAFGRARGVHAEDGSVTWTSYHALSTDVCDPLDNDPSSFHYRTCTKASTDGHGRVIDQVLRNRDPSSGAAETYRLWTYYRADGAVRALVRAQADTTTPRPASWTSGLPTKNVVRTFDYDSVGRRLSSDDPDTDDLTNPSEASNSWRYLFNRVGDLVAVRDPRGCGQNFFYDFGGRLVGEQYVSCDEAQSHAAELPPAENSVGGLIAMGPMSGNVSLDVVYHYDEYPAWAPARPAGASDVLGRATGVTDRAQRAVLAYDDRGNVTWTARQMAVISDELALGTQQTLDAAHSDLEYPEYIGDTRPYQAETPPLPGTVYYDTTNTYTRTATFDHAGRPRSMTLPTDPDYDGTAPLVSGTLTYNRRGLPASASATIGSETQVIVDAIEYLRDGLVSSLTYGSGVATSTTTYDIRRRPIRFRTTRTPTDTTPDTLAAVATPVDQQLVWDKANNLVAQVDHRDASEWPAGFRPQTVHIGHDSLYRVTGAEFDYTQSDGTRRPTDIGTDWRTNFAATRSADPMHQRPAEMASAPPPGRVASLTWSWDYLANTKEWGDDANSFYERSLGGITNGDDEGDTKRPSALYLASNIGSGTGGGAGWVEVDYGAGGNVEAMTVHSQCGDNGALACADPGGTLEDRRDALRDNCACAVEQHYVYRWDELNRMAEARRYDYEAGSWVRKVRQRYRYDAANVRTVKQTLDEQVGGAPGPGVIPRERVALYVYPGDFERRGLVTGFEGYEANVELGTETQYIIAGARTVWKHDGSPSIYDREQRLTVGLTDLIQTTAGVMDVRSGALLEASTYYPNGARETFLVDSETLTAPEVAGFTGKEGDEEVGVVYFGERYLIPRLGRWASPDPLHVHASGGGEALNSYHYVGGSLLLARDPIGLCGNPGEAECRGRVTATTSGRSAREQRRDIALQNAPGASHWIPIAAPDGLTERIEGNAAAEGAVWALSAESRTGRDGRIRVDNVQLHIGIRERDGNTRWERFDPRRWDSGGSAKSDEVGNFIIETVGTAGVSLIARVGTRAVGALTVRALDAAGERVMRGLAGAVDDAIVAGAREGTEALVPRVAESASSNAIRRVGDVLGTVDDVLANPNLVRGLNPADLQLRLGGSVPAGWRIEALGRGAHRGQGFVLRQYTPRGDPTGRQLRWHPGGGHHGPDPYWRVGDGTTMSGIIPAAPWPR